MSQFLKIQITYQLILIYYFNLKKAKHLLKIFEFEKREIKCTNITMEGSFLSDDLKIFSVERRINIYQRDKLE